MTFMEVTQQGELDISSIEKLPSEHLTQWIENRLQGKDTDIPEDYRQGDSPYFIITVIYPKLSRHVRNEIDQSILSFIKDMARNPDSIWKGEPGIQLLLLSQSVKLEEAKDILIEMAQSNRYFNGTAELLGKDIHYWILQTLIAMGVRIDREFWLEQFELAGERYNKVIFDGLCLDSMENGIRFLRSIKHENDLISTSFPLFIEEYGLAGIKLLIEKYIMEMQPDIRAALITFFKEEGVQLNIKHSNGFNYAYIRGFMERNCSPGLFGEPLSQAGL